MCTVVTGVQAAHGRELEMERERAKESIAAALREERQKSKVCVPRPVHVY